MRRYALLTWRTSRGMTQEALGDALGCSRRAISNWEGGVTRIPRFIELGLEALAARERPRSQQAET